MQLDAVRTLTNGATDPDPGVASTISAGLVFATRARQPNSDVPNTVLVLALEAPAAESVTVDLYSVFEDQAAPQDVGNLPGALASSRFYLVASGVVITGSRLLAREVFLGGQVYARVTADTLTTPRKLRATCAPGQASEAASGGTVVTTAQLPPTLGQQTKANSLSVTFPSNPDPVPVSATQLPAALGQTTKANSLPVVLPSNLDPVPVTDNGGSLTIDAPAIPSTAGQKTAANSLGVVLASDQTLSQLPGALGAQAAASSLSTVKATATVTDNAAYIANGNMGADIDGPNITVGPEGRVGGYFSWPATSTPVGRLVFQLRAPDGSTFDEVPGASAAFLNQPAGTAAATYAIFDGLTPGRVVRFKYVRTSGGTTNSLQGQTWSS